MLQIYFCHILKVLKVILDSESSKYSCRAFLNVLPQCPQEEKKSTVAGPMKKSVEHPAFHSRLDLLNYIPLIVKNNCQHAFLIFGWETKWLCICVCVFVCYFYDRTEKIPITTNLKYKKQVSPPPSLSRPLPVISVS